MVKHIVMWRLSDTCDKAAAASEIKSALESLVGKIPGLFSCRVSSSFAGTYDLVLETELESASALDAYQVNPLHVACKDIIGRYAVERIFADFLI